MYLDDTGDVIGSDSYLAFLHERGTSFEKIGIFLGVTRERARQRVQRYYRNERLKGDIGVFLCAESIAYMPNFSNYKSDDK